MNKAEYIRRLGQLTAEVMELSDRQAEMDGARCTDLENIGKSLAFILHEELEDFYE